MTKDIDLVRRIKQEMLEKYDGIHNGVGISSLDIIKDYYAKGMYHLSRDSLPDDDGGLCLTVGLLKQPDENFEYVIERDGVHIFYFVRGMPKVRVE